MHPETRVNLRTKDYEQTVRLISLDISFRVSFVVEGNVQRYHQSYSLLFIIFVS